MKKIHFSKPEFSSRDYSVILKALNLDGLLMGQKT